MNNERSPTRSSSRSVQQQQHQLLRDSFRTEGFFPQSVNDNSTFLEENTPECLERYSTESFDCVDGRFSNERRRLAGDGVESCRSGHSTSSDEGKGLKAEQPQPNRCNLRFKDNSESCFGLSCCENEKKYHHPGSSSSERLSDDGMSIRAKNYVKVKGAKQKQLEDNELDSDTRIYGKSPKFDLQNLNCLGHSRGEVTATFDCCGNLNHRTKIAVGGGGDLLTHERRYYDGADDEVSFNENDTMSAPCSDGVVFNTLDGFENDNVNENGTRPRMNLDMNPEDYLETTVYVRDEDVPEDLRLCRARSEQDYLRKNDERKFSAGQIKRPLSQDEDVSTKSGRVLDSPEVTPGDVGRMLNLGNALDGPRQTQANKYLSLVTLHLPVILKLSLNCPFQNVRIKCAEILEMVKVSENKLSTYIRFVFWLC